MTRFMLGCIVATGLGLAATAGEAAAQMLPPVQNNNMTGPAVSPYVNMNRTGNAAINYFALVKPQVNTNRQIQSLQQQVQQQGTMTQLGSPMADDEGLVSSYAITGHTSVFFNYSHYFGPNGVNRSTNQLAPAVKR